MKSINILIALRDDNTTNYLVLLESLICMNDKDNLILYIIGQSRNLQSYKKIDLFVKKNSINYVYFECPEYNGISMDKSVMSVLVSPYILPDDIDKVLYLNANILVNGKLDKLWDFNMESFAFAACENRWISRGANIGELEKAGKAETGVYYSSDVVLLNLHTVKKCLWNQYSDNVKANESGCADELEVVLNKYLSDYVIEMRDKKYNTQLMSYRKVSRKEKYAEAVLINYGSIKMQSCEKKDVDENLYELWWKYAKHCGIRNRNIICIIREKGKEIFYDKLGFSLDLLRFVMKKIVDNKVDFSAFDQIDFFKKHGL